MGRPPLTESGLYHVINPDIQVDPLRPQPVPGRLPQPLGIPFVLDLELLVDQAVNLPSLLGVVGQPVAFAAVEPARPQREPGTAPPAVRTLEPGPLAAVVTGRVIQGDCLPSRLAVLRV